MKRWLIIIIGAVVVLTIAGVMVLSWWRDQPMYYPGSLSSRVDLDPLEQSNDVEQWTVAKGIELHHYSVGDGRNVLMVHGGPGLPTRGIYPGLEELCDRFRFHYYDQRGCGRSSRLISNSWLSDTYENILALEQTLGIGAQVSDIERIRRILGDKEIVIIGHSYGAFLATLYASEFPEHVAALVLISPADLLTLPSTTSGLFEEIRKRLPENDRVKFDDWLERYLDLGSVFETPEEDLVKEDLEFARFYQTATVLHRVEEPKPEDIGAWMIRAQYFSMGRKHDYSEALRTVNAPVLVIHGEDDIQPEAVSELYSEALPNAEMQFIKSAGHFPQYDRPTEFVALVSDFLIGLDPL